MSNSHFRRSGGRKPNNIMATPKQTVSTVIAEVLFQTNVTYLGLLSRMITYIDYPLPENVISILSYFLLFFCSLLLILILRLTFISIFIYRIFHRHVRYFRKSWWRIPKSHSFAAITCSYFSDKQVLNTVRAHFPCGIAFIHHSAPIKFYQFQKY